MAIIVLRHPLRDRADGRTRVEVSGASVGEALNALERDHPGLKGWILDETGSIRRHVNVFVDGERADLGRQLDGETEVNIIQAISGGSFETELLVGSRKGLFVLRGERGGSMQIATRTFAGDEVEYALRDPRSGFYYAAVTSGFFGPRLFRTDDPLGEWEQTDGPAFPPEAGVSLQRIWMIRPGEEEGVLWAGVAPAALFRSDDSGHTWALNRGLWDQPTRPQWEGGGGGLCLHSICPWPGDPERMAVAISAVGVWLTDDGGKTWRHGIKGLVPRYFPDEVPEDTINLCVHNMHRAPTRPERLYLQFHGGVYRSDDAGETWLDIGSDGGLPSDFGFPMVIDPADPDRALVVPLTADLDRTTPDGAVRVFETRDAGETWSSTSQGLPRADAYLTILRQAFGHDGGDPLGLYFGATSGDVFGSADGGSTWSLVARHLPPVLSVRASA